MAYTDHPGCTRCGCIPEPAQTSAPDAKWRSCPCICHDTAKQLMRVGPTRNDMTEAQLARAWAPKETT